MTDKNFGLVSTGENPVPLTGIHVDGKITGRAAKVKVSQRYFNIEDSPIEAVYKFPLPEQASICGFRVMIGEKLLVGEVEEREKAFRLYDQALEKGDGAYLLDEERPNIFTLSVGALPSKTAAVIEIEFVTLLDTVEKDVRFFLPTTISPRYISPAAPDQGGMPTDALVNPPIQFDVPYGLRVHLVIEAKDQIAAIESPSHTITTHYEEDYLTVGLSAEEAKMDRDFILNIRYKESFRSHAHVFRDTRGTIIHVDFSPENEQEITEADPVSGRDEIIFVLDCSGSMDGSSIREAKQALLILLKALRDGTCFNIYRFGSTFEKLFPSSVPYTRETFEVAEKKIKGITADLGGTEMLEPLRDIYRSKASRGKSVVLITDGEIGDEQGVFDLAKSVAGATMIFTIGIGYGPNEYLIRQLARTSGGASEFVAPGERVEPKVLRLFGMIMSTPISDVEIDWPGRVIQAPVLPVVFAGNTVSIFGKLEDTGELPSSLRITATIGGTSRQWNIGMSFSADNTAIPCLWARERIRDLEEGIPGTGSKQEERKAGAARTTIVGLSKEYGMVCRDTSFVVVEKRAAGDKNYDEIVLRRVPAMLTRDYGGMGGHALKFSVPLSPTPGTMAHDSFSLTRSCYDFGFDDDTVDVMDGNSPSVNKDFQYMDDFVDDTFQPLGGHICQEQVINPVKKDAGLLYDILNSQRREGGFDVSPAMLKMAGLSENDFTNIADSITTRYPTNKNALLATYIILEILKEKFIDRYQEWKIVVRKSEEWLNNELNRTSPVIGGILLKNLLDKKQWSQTGEFPLFDQASTTRNRALKCLENLDFVQSENYWLKLEELNPNDDLIGPGLKTCRFWNKPYQGGLFPDPVEIYGRWRHFETNFDPVKYWGNALTFKMKRKMFLNKMGLERINAKLRISLNRSNIQVLDLLMEIEEWSLAAREIEALRRENNESGAFFLKCSKVYYNIGKKDLSRNFLLQAFWETPELITSQDILDPELTQLLEDFLEDLPGINGGPDSVLELIPYVGLIKNSFHIPQQKYKEYLDNLRNSQRRYEVQYTHCASTRLGYRLFSLYAWESRIAFLSGYDYVLPRTKMKAINSELFEHYIKTQRNH